MYPNSRVEIQFPEVPKS